MTIAQQLNVKEFPFMIKDKNGKVIYREWSNGYWQKREYGANGKETRFDDSHGYWQKREYNADGKETKYETSTGLILDYRPKPVELTLEDIATKFGIDVNQLKIKK